MTAIRTIADIIELRVYQQLQEQTVLQGYLQ
jgi:hypothetical protein